MKLIRDFSKYDTPTIFRALRSFRRLLIGYPLLFALIPTIGLVALRPRQLWWLIPVYFAGILFVTILIATAFGRLVDELNKRMNK